MKTCPQCQGIYPDDYLVCTEDGTRLGPVEVWPEGAVIQGKYRILGRIGQDAVCAVYKAVDLQSNQFQTLKLMNPDLARDPAFVQLLRQDALLRKKLDHANVSRVQEISEAEDGRPFIVMEYVAGQSLKKFIQRESPFAPTRACAVARQVAAGLEAIHALGMVHRDVKPQSIYLLDGSGDERVKLLGLGTSKMQEALLGSRFRTSPDAMIGTFEYLSPEQALGQLGDEIDGRVDIYSLGVVLYQMLTAHLPFSATTAADWMMAHIEGIPTPIRVAFADLAIPDPLIDLIGRCLKKNREQRPSSARQLIRELGRMEELIQPGAKEKIPGLDPGANPKSSGWKFWKH